jgi:hypothetical protein
MRNRFRENWSTRWSSFHVAWKRFDKSRFLKGLLEEDRTLFLQQRFPFVMMVFYCVFCLLIFVFASRAHICTYSFYSTFLFGTTHEKKTCFRLYLEDQNSREYLDIVIVKQ